MAASPDGQGFLASFEHTHFAYRQNSTLQPNSKVKGRIKVPAIT